MLTSKTKELILIDAGPQEDLLIWDQLGRALSRLDLRDRFLCLIVGSAEAAEQVLESKGYPVERTVGELGISSGAASVFEKVLRDEKRRISLRLTDQGISAVGFLGTERSILRVNEEQILVSESLEKTLWQAPGVVPVLMSVGVDTNGLVVDLHPARVACAISSNLSGKPSVTVLSQRLTESVREISSLSKDVLVQRLVCEKALSETWARLPFEDDWEVSHASFFGR